MKKVKLWHMVFVVQLMILSVSAMAQTKDEMGKKQDTDLAEYKIVNAKVVKYFNTDKIKVRRLSFSDRPQKPIPVLKLREPDDAFIEKRMNKILETLVGEQTKSRKQGNIIMAKADGFVFWVHQASGGYKYTKKGNEVVKTSFGDFKDAVNTALETLAETEIVRLVEGEELDILSVSAVKNAVANVEKPDPPQELFISEYYISFGRRFNGIPIIGSYLVVRLDGEKRPVMVKMNWREIVGTGEVVEPVKKEIHQVLAEHPDYRKACGEQKESRDIVITQMQSGYIEAPINFRQRELRPGSLVLFKTGLAVDEDAVQLVLPLEEKYAGKSILGEISN
ncbi:MAG: hypothetical protein SWO11_06655 [Thermodesulfobacteriota bacterium]|nr:hypothetical protein [Thermodesulfobacteriota bacterium]